MVSIESRPSKWIEAFPMKTQDTKTIANILFEEVFARFRAPRILVTDLGKQFTSNLVTALCELFQVKRCVTSSYRPHANGHYAPF